MIGSAFGREETAQFDFPSYPHRRKKFNGVSHYFVEVQVFRIEGCLFHQLAYPPNDVTCALVIPYDVVQRSRSVPRCQGSEISELPVPFRRLSAQRQAAD